ncbi:MAG: hypothetical protein ACOYWZ_12720 [Bacillota bacterium]
MDKFCYCLDCQRIFNTADQCPYCSSKRTKELTQKAPVNVIGSKLKGRVLNTKEGIINVLFIDEGKNKTIKQFEADKIRKIL